MKNLSLVFNIILLVLVGVLFYFHFSGKNGASEAAMPDAKGMSILNKGKSVRIAYINVDSLSTKYQNMVDIKKDMESRTNTLQTEYDSKSKVAQEEYMSLQQRMQSGNISQLDQEKAEKDLQAKKQELDNLQRKGDELAKEQQDKYLQVLIKVQNYIKSYNKKIGLDYVLAYTKTGSIYYANDSLDITKDIVSGLNKEYADSLSKVASKPH